MGGAAVRGRFGAGKGFEIGVEIQSVPEWGVVMLDADLKWQFLKQAGLEAKRNGRPRRVEAAAPFNMAVDVGAGASSFSNFAYAELIASRNVEMVEPYLSYRFQVIRTFDLEEDDALLDRNQFHHVFFGIRIDIVSSFYITPEGSFIAFRAKNELVDDRGDGLGWGLAVGFRW
ncbi:MAG: hypothetical protein HY716_11160 [Planctomycetes bacterium]|nr:hypothetical protein [Planctomycetota bacterium]